MSPANAKARGTQWESAIVGYLNDHGWPLAERRAGRGAKDAGDIAGLPAVIEAKAYAHGSLRLPEWTAEAQAESVHAGVPGRWAVVAKRQGRTSPAAAWVVTNLDHYLDLLSATLRPAAPTSPPHVAEPEADDLADMGEMTEDLRLAERYRRAKAAAYPPPPTPTPEQKAEYRSARAALLGYMDDEGTEAVGRWRRVLKDRRSFDGKAARAEFGDRLDPYWRVATTTWIVDAAKATHLLDGDEG